MSTGSRVQEMLSSPSLVDPEHVARYQAFYVDYTEDDLEGLRALAAPTMRYRDALVDCRGIDAVLSYMRKWFKDSERIQVEVTTQAAVGRFVLTQWTMRLHQRKAGKGTVEVEGMSRLTFDEEGKITEHADYWDMVPVFEDVPVLGRVVTYVKGAAQKQLQP